MPNVGPFEILIVLVYVAVVVAIEEFQNLKRRSVKKKRPLLEVLRRCPAPEIFTQLDQQRNNPDFGRTITLDE